MIWITRDELFIILQVFVDWLKDRGLKDDPNLPTVMLVYDKLMRAFSIQHQEKRS